MAGKLTFAVVAQLVEHHLAKVNVASSNLVYRSHGWHGRSPTIRNTVRVIKCLGKLRYFYPLTPYQLGQVQCTIPVSVIGSITDFGSVGLGSNPEWGA